jgi:two-component system invasion response regulator UvrY
LNESRSIKPETPSAPQVLVVSDQALAGAGYKALLSTAGIHRTTVAASVDEGLSLAGALHWDLVMLDVSTLNSLNVALTTLRAVSINLSILVMGDMPESQVARLVLSAGARGYFHKGGSSAAFRSAVQTVLAGRRYLSAVLAEQLQGDRDGSWKKGLHECLSARELAVFAGLASGKSVTSIGQELSLSIKTVSTYRTRLLRKMGFSSNAEIITYAIRNGLIQ